MQRRNTIQKDLVLQTVQRLKSHVSADEVYEEVRKTHPNVGKGTVYRNLSLLAEEGKIRHIEIPNAPDRFDFTLQEHFHVQCALCGKVEDVELNEAPDLLNHVVYAGGMQLLSYDILFKGICPECRKDS